MDDDARREFLDRVARYQQRDDPTGWCDKVYSDAGGDPAACSGPISRPIRICWPGSASKPCRAKASDAAAVGCGVGDDAEALAAHAYRVTAFDIAPAAIELCRSRYPDSRVDYRVADLFDPPHDWVRGFDLVYECNTIQILPGVYRLRALAAIAGMVAPGGVALVSCRSRLAGEKEGEFPCRWTVRKSTASCGPDSGKRLSSPTMTTRTRRCRTFRCLPPGASGSGPGLDRLGCRRRCAATGRAFRPPAAGPPAPAPTRQTVPPPVRAPAGHWHACADRRNAG